jgi:LppP/LprE lipoprotein
LPFEALEATVAGCYDGLTQPAVEPAPAPPEEPPATLTPAQTKQYAAGYNTCFGFSHHFDVPPAPDLRNRSAEQNAEGEGCRDAIARRPNRAFESLPAEERHAIQVVADHDWNVIDARKYGSPTPGLHALLGDQEAGGSGLPLHVFFFLGGRYLGTDTSEPSEGIRIAWAGTSTVGVEYTIWKKSDAHCCPTGGHRLVRYHWTGTKLVPLDPIPALAERY